MASGKTSGKSFIAVSEHCLFVTAGVRAVYSGAQVWEHKLHDSRNRFLGAPVEKIMVRICPFLPPPLPISPTQVVPATLFDTNK